jgi:hypothetical protein
MRLFFAGTAAAATLTAVVMAMPAQRGAPAAPSPAAPVAQAPARDAAVPFRVGETLMFDVSWSQFLTAGTATLQVLEKAAAQGASAYRLQADGRPIALVERFFPVYYKLEAMLDAVTLLSQRTTLYSEENGQKQTATTRFDRRAQRAFHEVQGEPPVKEGIAMPPNTQDGLSAIYAARGRAFRAGERFTIPIADGGTVYSAEFVTSGPERVVVPFASLDAWKLDVTIRDAQRQPMTTETAAWISTDARRLPLKMQSNLPVGQFMLVLREAH